MDTILEQLRKNHMAAQVSGEDVPAGSDRKPREKDQEEAPKLRGRYRCRVCGYIFDEAEEGKPFSTLTECPLCHVSPGGFMQIR